MRNLRTFAALCLAAAALTGTSAASATAAPTAGSCDTRVNPDRHWGGTKCSGFSEKYYRVMLQVCSGSGRCEIRYGEWKKMGSGVWSERSDTATWINNAGYQLGN
ncbi:hypothetical protein ABZX85_11810 [Streptomyces sp. NPDC004539]|uniref:hypothetical protein n=1 Tax=Streptomyces sp. NPDC004539 TaxID=3154280 RepID=UPI0033A9ACB0